MSAFSAIAQVRLNGRRIDLAPDTTPVLADALHAHGARGVRVACDHGVCGACTVRVDGRLATACSTLTASVDGCSVDTIESSGTAAALGPVQAAFIAERAFQCGMCTPGMVALAQSLLERHPDPTPEQVRAWMGANVCRCTGYQTIEAAVLHAAAAVHSTAATQALRPEDIAKVTGQPMFTMDIALHDLAEAKVLRSPHAHARIVSIDTAAAAALDGVYTVVTGADLQTMAVPTYGLWIKDQPVLAIDRVRHVGDPVAAVLARDASLALRALDLIRVVYEPLGAVATTAQALAPGAPQLFDTPSPGVVPPHGAGVTTAKEPAPNVLYEFRHTMGDVAAAFAEADHIFEDSFAFSRMSHIHLEPLVTLARPMGRGVEIWSCNQDPFLLRQDIGEMFGLPEHLVRVHTGAIGGGFGAKSFCKVEPLVVLLALNAGRAVRLSLSMDESMLTLSQHSAQLQLVTAVRKDGRLLARRADIVLDAGAYADASALVADKVGYRIGGPYRWQALDSRARSVRTHTVPAGSYRGFGGTQASWASESQIDMIARRLKLDPVEMRRINLLHPGEPFRPGDSAMDCDLAAGLDAVAARIGWGQASAASAAHCRRGKGIAIGFKDGGGQGRYAQARVKVTADGNALVSCATVDMGQGATEVFRRIVAEVLSLDPSRVGRADIDTDQTAFDQGTHASSATVITGEAVRRAAEAVRDRILAFATQQWECSAALLSLADGHVLRGDQRTPLATLVRSHYGGLGTEFEGVGEVKIASDARAPLHAPIVYWMPNWVAAEVEIDTQTGQLSVLQLISAADVGKALVPAAVHGQIQGAALQGLGQALYEQLVVSAGEPLNATPQRYRVPLAGDLPAVFESIVLEHGLGRGPLGAKGVGEAGILGVCAAIANAIEDATGARLTALPMTPDAVLAALDALAGSPNPVPT